jgi:hypothetical protein
VPGSDTQSPRRKVRTEAAPVLQKLIEAKLLDQHHRVLCFGCGRGVDVGWLKVRKFKAHGYDPYPAFGYSDDPEGKFDFVFLIYLMARLKNDEGRRSAIERASQHVRPGGYLAINSRNLPRMAADGGAADPVAYVTDLVQGLDFESVEEAGLDLDDGSVCMLARKAGIYQPENPIEWIDDPARFAELCKQLQRESFVALDVETTLEEPRVLCTIQLGIEGQTWIVDALAMDSLEPIRPVLEHESVEKVIHNAFFEQEMFAKHQMKINGIFDTLTHSRRKHSKANIEGGHKLGEVCERELGIYLDKSQQTSDWTVRPLADVQMRYAAIDAEVLVDLYPIFKPPEVPENMDLFG